jgi:hypothetical protein
MSAVPRPRSATLLGFGMNLARRGFLAWASIAIGILTVLGMAVVAIVLSGRGARPPLHTIPIVTSSMLAWGGGFTLAFAVAVHALRRDVEGGIRHMLEGRAVDLRGYLLVRVGGLAAVIGVVVAGGTLVVGLFASLLAIGSGGVGRSLQATLASVAFGLAFAAVIAPTALFALGARKRLGGYLFLFFIVVFPELVVETVGDAIPRWLADMLTIPSALGALRGSLTPGVVDLASFARSLVSVAIYATATTLLVRREAENLRFGDLE